MMWQLARNVTINGVHLCGKRSIASPFSSSPARVSPAARFIIESQSLDVSKLVGSAKNGVISKEDVMVALKEGRISSSTSSSSAPSLHQPQHLNAVKPPSPSPSSPASSSSPSPAPVQSSPANAPINSKYVDVPCSNMRKVIAKRLTQSKAQVPHFYSTIDCEIDAMLAFRAKLKKDFGINVSVNDLVIKAAALALRDVPEANSQLRGGGAGKLKLDKKVDISVAVATPSGLITPIVTDADQRGLSSINAAVKDLATRARDGKLKPEEYQGGSFTISNLGMFGISEFSAVINPPQACILAVGGGIKRMAPPSSPGGKPRVVTSLTVQLSGDRRIVDEAVAALYLQVFREYVSNPMAALV